MEENDTQTFPLLTPLNNQQHDQINTVIFTAKSDDISPITGAGDFAREFLNESKKLWYLAGPAIFTSISQYSLGAVTQVFAGQVGTLQLAAVSVENSVIAGFCLGITMGMGSALETLCGQAFGAGKLNMLGIYMQRSWLILSATALILSFLYIFASPLLKLIGQTTAISEAAGVFALWMIPQLFAYAVNFPTQKFLQAQSKIMAMAWISAVALVGHTFFSWFLMLHLGWGLVGAAVVLNSSWWFIVLAQIVYVLSGSCGEAWSGFSFQAFQNLWGFVRLSLASAVMMCLEVWYFMALILFAGYLENAEVSVDALSICANILGWTVMASFGINAAISVRVSNELGASHPRAAKFSLVVAVITSFVIGLILSLILIIFRKQYPVLFSNDPEVREVVIELTPMLALCIVINNIQPVLSGVAIGAGWQSAVAYVNIACYYLFGIPLGLFFGYHLDFGVLVLERQRGSCGTIYCSTSCQRYYSEALKNALYDILDRYKLSISRIRGQGYDGAEIFYVAIDKICVEMDHRFSEGSNIVLNCFSCLDPKNYFFKFDVDKLARLADIYHANFSDDDRGTIREQLDTYVLQVKRHASFSSCEYVQSLAMKMVQTEKLLVFPLVYKLI